MNFKNTGPAFRLFSMLPKLRVARLTSSFGRQVPSRTLSTRTLKAALQEGAPIDVHPEVQDALAHGKPVVALETTIVTHGMPYPTNLTTARSVEQNVRDNGAIPATIGFIGGRVKIGLEPSELERLADVENNKGVVKVSRRDIGATIALKKDGGTTCSATLIFAALAGIKVCYHPETIYKTKNCHNGFLISHRCLQPEGKDTLIFSRYLLSMMSSLGGVHRGGENCE